MPLYEFQCKNCGEILEKLMKVSDPNPEKCEICEKGPMVKLMSKTHFVLKGQGWYETDFKNSRHVSAPTTDKNSESGNKDKTPKKSGDSSTPSSSSESKPSGPPPKKV